MKPPVFRPAAAADVQEAYRWYEVQRVGLGEEFLAAVTTGEKGGKMSGDLLRNATPDLKGGGEGWYGPMRKEDLELRGIE